MDTAAVGRGLRTYDALALTALLWFLAKFVRYAFPPLFPALGPEFGVSNAALGAAYTVMMATYAAMQFPSGALADRGGPVRVIAGGAVLAGVAAATLAVPASFPVLVGGMALVGLGTGVHKTVAVTMLSTVYADRPGRALGVLDTVGAVGGAAAPVAAVALLEGPGWRALFPVAGLAALALAGLFLRRVPRHLPDPAGTEGGDSDVAADSDGAGDPEPADGSEPSDDRPAADAGAADDSRPTDDPGPATASDAGAEAGERTGLRRYGGLFADRHLLAVTVVSVFGGFAYNGVVAFLPLYLTAEAGFSTALAGSVFGLLFLLSLVQAATGELSDRFGELPMLVGTLGVGTAGFALLLAAPSPAVVVVAVVAFGLGMHGFRPIRGAYLMTLLPAGRASGALGVVRTGIIGASAAAPAVVGAVADAAGFRAAFGLLLAALAVAAALLVAVFLAGRAGGTAPGAA